ncbi:MAG: hypothetical protein LBO69_02940 [Ignavibacteria bacterium]|jgi:hypothetical protein|nr:hypothetical protein [Ignavibacteria bacterium]
MSRLLRYLKASLTLHAKTPARSVLCKNEYWIINDMIVGREEDLNFGRIEVIVLIAVYE